MKKFFVFLFLVCFFGTVFSQKGNEIEISKMIKNAEKENRMYSGVTNPNEIFPGQRLIYHFPNWNDQWAVYVKKGDCQWTIVRDMFEQGVYAPTPQIPVVVPENSSRDQKIFESDFLTFLANIPWWVLLLFVIGCIALVLAVYKDRVIEKKKESKQKEWTSDPITSGKPQVSGGVPDSGAHQRAAKIIEQRYPSATFVVTKIYRGKLSGPAQIYYDGELQPKERILDNIDAYEGISMVNGKEEKIYFLQGCGNDARFGNFMKGSNLVFTRTVEIGQDGSEISNVQESSVVNEAGIKEEVKNEAEVEKPKATEVIGSELYRTISSHVLLAEDFLKNQTAHKVTLKVTTPQGTVETILETKIEVKQDKKTNEEGSKK